MSDATETVVAPPAERRVPMLASEVRDAMMLMQRRREIDVAMDAMAAAVLKREGIDPATVGPVRGELDGSCEWVLPAKAG